MIRSVIQKLCSNVENRFVNAICSNRDLFVSIIIISFLLFLDFINIIKVESFSPSLAAAIFTVIITTIGTLFSILSLYNRVLQRAYKQDYYDRLKRTFMIPVSTGVWGFIISTLGTVVSVEPMVRKYIAISTLVYLFTVTMLFLLFYSILSFYAAFKFVLSVVLKKEKKAAEESKNSQKKS